MGELKAVSLPNKTEIIHSKKYIFYFIKATTIRRYARTEKEKMNFGTN